MNLLYTICISAQILFCTVHLYNLCCLLCTISVVYFCIVFPWWSGAKGLWQLFFQQVCIQDRMQLNNFCQYLHNTFLFATPTMCNVLTQHFVISPSSVQLHSLETCHLLLLTDCGSILVYLIAFSNIYRNLVVTLCYELRWLSVCTELNKNQTEAVS